MSVAAAGGYLIQLLPFADEKVIDIIENNIKSLPSVTEMLSSGVTVEEMALKVLDGLTPNVLDDFSAEYKCDCSKERVERALISIGRNDLKEMAAENENTEVCCHFCDKKYSFSSEELIALSNR